MKKKLGLLAAMLALGAVMAAVVMLGSPYAPAVEPYREIEEIWAIEDARSESETPLVTRLEHDGVPLGYDAETNTFYCTLGLDGGDEWPQIHLTAPGAQPGLSLCFVDDYSYDYRSDAVREGYAYQAIAYTAEEFSYFDIVFTGMPVLTLHAKEEIGTLDVPAQLSFGGAGIGGMSGPARVHQRGDSSSLWTKKRSFKVEFTRNADGTGKTVRSVPGLTDTDEILLLAMGIDQSAMHDRLSWEMLSYIWPQEESFSPRPVQYVEVFVDDCYEGLYLMMTPYDLVQELGKGGAQCAATDSLYRTFMEDMTKDRPVLLKEEGIDTSYELFYTQHTGDGFEPLAPYLDMLREEDDAAFAAMAAQYIDLDSLLRYVLLLQSMALSDNTTNNMYIWAHQEDGQTRYRFAMWDMDLTWAMDPGPSYDYWFTLPLHDRVIHLDVNGARARMREIWLQMQAQGFTAGTVERLVEGYVRELEDSGAFARDAERWQKDIYSPDGYELTLCAQERFEMMDILTKALAESDEVFDFLAVGQREELHAITLFDLLQELKNAE